jgi:hypothetical protein
MKGKPWSLEDEKKLKDWINSGVSVDALVFSFDGQYTKDAILKKADRLGLEVVVVEKKFTPTTTSNIEIPEELFSVEEILKELHVAVMGLKTPGLDKTEVIRLRGIISGCKVYKEMLVDYMEYRGLEAELLEWKAKYEQLAKKGP